MRGKERARARARAREKEGGEGGEKKISRRAKLHVSKHTPCPPLSIALPVVHLNESNSSLGGAC